VLRVRVLRVRELSVGVRELSVEGKRVEG